MEFREEIFLKNQGLENSPDGSIGNTLKENKEGSSSEDIGNCIEMVISEEILWSSQPSLCRLLKKTMIKGRLAQKGDISKRSNPFDMGKCRLGKLGDSKN